MAVSGITINGDGTATWLITAEDSATLPKGRIPVSIKMWRPFIPRINDLYAYWSMDEASGTRALTAGSTTGDLLETDGAVASAAGRFGLAASKTSAADSAYLRAELATEMPVSGGMIASFWFWWKSGAPAAASVMLYALGTAGLTWPVLVAVRQTDDTIQTYLKWGASWVAPIPAVGVVTGVVTAEEWHLLTITYDAATGVYRTFVDGALAGTDTVLPADLAVANSSTLKYIAFISPVDGVNLIGRIDTAMLMPVVLSANEIAGMYTAPNPVETASGDVQSQDSSTALTVTPATWTTAGGLALTLSETTFTQGSAFSSVITATDAAGDTVDLTGWSIFPNLSYEPQGSASAIQFITPDKVTISGEIRYTEYPSGIIPRPTPIWPSVTVSLYDSTNVLLGTATADSNGLYQFVGTVGAGVDVYVKVAAQLPPGEALNENKTGTTFTTTLGVTAVNLVCDRAPI